jgi:hypothetical protein
MMGTSEDLRFEKLIKARVRLKLSQSKQAIQFSDWIERNNGISATFNAKHELGSALDPPASMGRARPYFPQSEWGSEEYERVNGQIDREYQDYVDRCEAFANIGERIAPPPLPERPTLAPELAEVDAKLVENPANVTFNGLRAHVIERQRTLSKRIDATVPREWLVELVAAVNVEVERFTGIKQTATLPPVENDLDFIRRMGCREG